MCSHNQSYYLAKYYNSNRVIINSNALSSKIISRYKGLRIRFLRGVEEMRCLKNAIYIAEFQIFAQLLLVGVVNSI